MDFGWQLSIFALIGGFLIFSVKGPESFNKKVFNKYGQSVIEEKASYAVGVFFVLWIFSLLFNVLVFASTPIIIVLMCKKISDCWSKSVEIGLSQTEIRTALFYQIIYPLGVVWFWVGIITILTKHRRFIYRER